MADLQQIVNKRTTPGVLIMDGSHRLLHSNREALSIVPIVRPVNSDDPQGELCVPEDIVSLCNRLKQSGPTVTSVHGSLGEQRDGGVYALRAFYINNPAGGEEPRSIMVLMERVVEKHEVDFERVKRDYALSKRELEVLRQIYRGLTNREIAEMLFICEYTVKDHIKKIMKRMGVKSRGEMVALLR